MESNQLRIRIGLISAAVVLVIFIITRMKACEDQLLEGYVLKEQQKLLDLERQEAWRRGTLRWCVRGTRESCIIDSPVLANDQQLYASFRFSTNVGVNLHGYVAYTIDLKKNSQSQYVGTAEWPTIMNKRNPTEVFALGLTSEVTCERGVNPEGEDLWLFDCTYKIVKGQPDRIGEEGSLQVLQDYPGI